MSLYKYLPKKLYYPELPIANKCSICSIFTKLTVENNYTPKGVTEEVAGAVGRPLK
jgi:hypothetical protein